MDLKLSNTYSVNKPPRPSHLMTEEEYKARIIELSKSKNFLDADEGFLNRLNSLTLDLKNMITYNKETVTNGGTVYYVAADGDDNNDGLSPETPWATTNKVNKTKFDEPVTILFKRNDEWRGYIDVKSNMTFSAYGEGLKPKIISAYDASDKTKWVKTKYENVWRYDVALPDVDIPMIVYGNGTTYGIKKTKIADLKEDLDFIYNSSWTDETENDNKAYVYSKRGNPAEILGPVNINMLIKPADCTIIGLHDVMIHNLEFVYGRGVFFATRSKNVRMSYCVAGWGGGHYTRKEKHLRYGGGAGAWHSCDKMIFDNCYFYQQFDSGVSPQYHMRDLEPSVFKDFITYNCLFETTEYTLEYFQTQNTSSENHYDGMYFGYNLCRLGGYGYGDKTEKSRYVKSWGHENPCYNCQFEYNIFDRAADISLEVIGHAPNLRGKHVSYEHIPKMNNNIYIEPKNKLFANINHIEYKFNEASYITLEKLGVETDALYVFCDKKDDEVIAAEQQIQEEQK